MQEIRTILAYIDGLTDDHEDSKPLPAKKWGLIKTRLKKIEEIMDRQPIQVPITATASVPVAPAPFVPKTYTQEEFVKIFQQTAMRGGMSHDEAHSEDMLREFNGLYTPDFPDKDPVVMAEVYMQQVFNA